MQTDSWPWACGSCWLPGPTRPPAWTHCCQPAQSRRIHCCQPPRSRRASLPAPACRGYRPENLINPLVPNRWQLHLFYFYFFHFYSISIPPVSHFYFSHFYVSRSMISHCCKKPTLTFLTHKCPNHTIVRIGINHFLYKLNHWSSIKM